MSGEIFPFLIVLNPRFLPYSTLSTISSFEHSQIFELAFFRLLVQLFLLSLHTQSPKNNENISTVLAIAANFNVV